MQTDQADKCGGVLVVYVISPLTHNKPEHQKAYFINTIFEIIWIL